MQGYMFWSLLYSQQMYEAHVTMLLFELCQVELKYDNSETRELCPESI